MTTKTKPHVLMLRRLGACREAIEFASGFHSLRAAWLACERPDWMLWLYGRCNPDRVTCVRMACEFARLALPFVPKGENRPLRCIEVTEAWTRGEATIDEVREARRGAAYAAAYAYAYAYAYVYAAAAAADAATYAATYAAAAATYAADAAAYAYADAECAAIVRKYLPTPPRIAKAVRS